MERGKIILLALIPLGSLTHTHDSRVRSIQGMEPILPSVAACAGLVQLFYCLTLRLSHLCHPGPSTVLPRQGAGPLFLNSTAKEGSRTSSLTLMPSEPSLPSTASDQCGDQRSSPTTHSCHITADKWQGHLSFTYYLGIWIICEILTRASLAVLPR